MKYIYAYKTSDGIRHEDSMNASSREEVFNQLRAMGIKAIKVVAADGSKANGEIVVKGIRKRVALGAIIVTALVAGLAVFLTVRTPHAVLNSALGSPSATTFEFTSDVSRSAFTNLEAQARQIIANHDKAIEALEFDLLANYQFIENTKDTTIFTDKIKAGYKAIDASRMATRDLFKSIFNIFPAECATERTEAQRLYAETMERLDVSESRIVNDEKAFKILSVNRGKWHCVKGKVKWTDAALANEFEYFRRDVNPAAVRWRKDFNVIEADDIKGPEDN